MSGLPRITGAARGGWELQSGHVPGSLRMLACWAASLASPVVVVPALAGPLGLHTAMLMSLLLAVAGLAAGVAVYARYSRTFVLPETGRWEPSTPVEVWPSLADTHVLADDAPVQRGEVAA